MDEQLKALIFVYSVIAVVTIGAYIVILIQTR